MSEQYNGFRHDRDPGECHHCQQALAEGAPCYTEHGMVYCTLGCMQRLCSGCFADLHQQAGYFMMHGSQRRFCEDACGFTHAAGLHAQQERCEAREVRDRALDLTHP